jgi:tetratricopeptide (TPR) repeat protein
VPDWKKAIKAFSASLLGGASTSPRTTGDIRDRSVRLIDQRIRSLEQEIARAAVADRAPYLNDLANRLRDRYQWTGELGDLERAIENYEHALESTSPSTPVSTVALISGNLSVGLLDRYTRTGQLSDLERSVQIVREALARTPSGFVEEGRLQSNLSNALLERYRRTRLAPDLRVAIEASERSAALLEPGSRERAVALTNLSGGLIERYSLETRISDLDDAIRMLEEAAATTTAGSPEHGVVTANLGAALTLRQTLRQETPELSELDRAAEALSSTASHAPARSLALHSSLHSLGRLNWERYQRSGDPKDLQAAITSYGQAIAQTDDNLAELPMYLNNYGISLSELFFLTGNPAAMQPAITVWERALSLLRTTFSQVPVSYKLGQQREAAGEGTDQRLLGAYLTLAEAEPEKAPSWLRRAMVVAEASKARMLTELVGRANLPAPPGVAPDLVRRERELLAELSALDASELAAYGQTHTSGADEEADARLERRREQRGELDKLWSEIAALGDQASDYVALRRGDPLDWDDLMSLASAVGEETALVSAFSTNSRTVLFILRAGWDAPAVVEVPLDQVGLTDLLRRYEREMRFGHGSRGVTWNRPLQSLVEAAASHLSGASHVVLSPQGWNLQLPWAVLAAEAGWKAPNGEPLPLATLPGLALLPRLRRRPQRDQGEVLVVGNPTGDLEHGEEEARQVAELLGTESLLRSQATKEAVMARLPRSSVVHLAAHATFVPGSPLDSGVELADGLLTAREVLSQALQIDLLTLSGCETGVSEALGGDELAGLSQAFAQAGARSLLVSLWNVDDPATALLMKAFYVHRLSGVDKALALSRAMAETRSRPGLVHPYFWGAFILLGDW